MEHSPSTSDMNVASSSSTLGVPDPRVVAGTSASTTWTPPPVAVDTQPLPEPLPDDGATRWQSTHSGQDHVAQGDTSGWGAPDSAAGGYGGSTDDEDSHHWGDRSWSQRAWQAGWQAGWEDRRDAWCAGYGDGHWQSAQWRHVCRGGWNPSEQWTSQWGDHSSASSSSGNRLGVIDGMDIPHLARSGVVGMVLMAQGDGMNRPRAPRGSGGALVPLLRHG